VGPQASQPRMQTRGPRQLRPSWVTKSRLSRRAAAGPVVLSGQTLTSSLKHDTMSAVKGPEATMPATKLATRVFWAMEAVLLGGTIVAAIHITSSGEWQPPELVALLVALALLGQWLSVEISGGELSASLVAIVLAMALLGPVPAATCGVAVAILRSLVGRLPWAQWLNNLSTFAAVPFVGGLLVRLLAGDVHATQNQHLTQGATFGLIVFGVFVITVGMSFMLFALDLHFEENRPLARVLQELVALAPGELAVGALATMLALAYASVGISMLLAAITVLLIFRQLTVALLRSEERADQLSARSRQLVGLQLGVLRTLVRALSMRDQTTGRHAGAVALYAKALAAELDCSEEDQDMVHAAGLLHEIGKFTWPDRVLHASTVEDADLGIVKNHPQEGAVLVGALDGYGPVADAILYHHERVDGLGYPAGLIASEIPLASRILAICCTYATMSAQDGYRSSMTPEEAIEELQSGARNGQLDPDLVATFVALLEREGPRFAEGADFETELDFDRRVREMAQPRSASAPREARVWATDGAP
jgi:HD domain-containing protein